LATLAVFACGNPARGDDALGPELLARLESSRASADVVFYTDYQWQIEHALDLQGVEQALFIDANVSCPPPFQFSRLQAAADFAYTTHALPPAVLLHVYRQTLGKVPPPAYMLSLRGSSFELGEPLSPTGEAALTAALPFAERLLAQPRHWDAWIGQAP
jgi:hydrogenase maturation protease